MHADAFSAKIASLEVFTVITGVETALTDSFQYHCDQLKLLFNGSRKRLLSERGPENELNLLDGLLMQGFSTSLKRFKIEFNVYQQMISYPSS
jgi:hypothetical protein